MHVLNWHSTMDVQTQHCVPPRYPGILHVKRTHRDTDTNMNDVELGEKICFGSVTTAINIPCARIHSQRIRGSGRIRAYAHRRSSMQPCARIHSQRILAQRKRPCGCGSLHHALRCGHHTHTLVRACAVVDAYVFTYSLTGIRVVRCSLAHAHTGTAHTPHAHAHPHSPCDGCGRASLHRTPRCGHHTHTPVHACAVVDAYAFTYAHTRSTILWCRPARAYLYSTYVHSAYARIQPS